MKSLPIHNVLPLLKKALSTSSTAILQAPPGAGKSTVVPLALLNENWLGDRMIIMLEPRRVAARMVAAFMARSLGEEVGERVGYHIKLDKKISKKTKVLVVTEGILVRMLQSDPSLENIALVIFDEFHERSIHTDVSLALCLQVQEILRADLKLLVMSATLNTEALQGILGEVPVLTSLGKSYNVDMHYLLIHTPPLHPKSMTSTIVATVQNALEKDTGDILVFLPGQKEIHSLQNALHVSLKEDVLILPLYSSLSKKEQDRAIVKASKRKVILSTNIAQTSLTIEGIGVVIDTGFEKLSWYDPATGMDHLKSSFISEDAATQRSGRAGRLSDGECYRLWHEQKILHPSSKAEILRADLSNVFLDLALWGVDEWSAIAWLDSPKDHALDETKEVCQELRVLDAKGKITSFGKDALRLGVHPRFAYMILKANALDYGYEGCLLAALLQGKELFLRSHDDCDLLSRFEYVYYQDFENPFINQRNAKEICKEADLFLARLKQIQQVTPLKKYAKEMIAVLALYAYPDRLAKQRNKTEGRYKLSNGKGALLSQEDTLFGESLLVVPHLNAKEENSFITLAAPISEAMIETYFKEHLRIQESITYNKEAKRFDAKETRNFLHVELSSIPLSLKGRDLSALIIALLKKEGLSLLPWSAKAIALKQRISFVFMHTNELGFDVSDAALCETLEKWLSPYLVSMRSLKELEGLDMHAIMLASLCWEEQQRLDVVAPKSIEVPSGSHISIDYSQPDTPALHVKIQEVFGLHTTPCVLEGALPLQLHLLSPAMRPIQITYDLHSFWETSYDEVRKELRGKYKKHYWPENPYDAIATNKTKKNMLKG